MEAIQKFMDFVTENWTAIFAVIVICIAICQQIQAFLRKSKEEQEAIIMEQIEIAKEQVREIMLKLVTEAEKDYREWIKAGEIKRAQVIDAVFEKYPILLMVTNQAELIEWLDKTIDEALKKMRKIFEENEKAETTGYSVAGWIFRKQITEGETEKG